MLKKVAILIISLVTGMGGFFLAQYGQADDAPGAALIAIVVVIGAVALATIALKRTAAVGRSD